MIRIEICGGIASGKTTLGKLLGDSGAVATFEDFKSNPFWEAFYSDIEKYSFETEISFFLQHYHQIKSNSGNLKPLACDFSLFLDKAYANVTLPENHRKVFMTVFDEAITHIPKPSLLIHLKCPPDVELARIRDRARPVEQTITTGYLASINEVLDSLVEEVSETVPVFEIDSDSVDFAHDSNVREKLAGEILAGLGA